MLETIVERYLKQHERYPVIVMDHVDPAACDLGNPGSPLMQLGRTRSPTVPSARPVIVVDDAGLEALRQGESDEEPGTSGGSSAWAGVPHSHGRHTFKSHDEAAQPWGGEGDDVSYPHGYPACLFKFNFFFYEFYSEKTFTEVLNIN
jgi:hypothetical protein